MASSRPAWAIKDLVEERGWDEEREKVRKEHELLAISSKMSNPISQNNAVARVSKKVSV